MTSYAKGNQDAFECLYNRHKTKLFAFLHRQSNNYEHCEELAHDTWLAVIRQSSQYQVNAKFTTWLFRIAHNKLVDYWRKHTPELKLLIQEINEYEVCVDSDIESKIALNDLLHQLEALPTDQIETLLLKIEGFSYEEIAEITHTKKETVKSRLRYANKKLRNTLKLSSDKFAAEIRL